MKMEIVIGIIMAFGLLLRHAATWYHYLFDYFHSHARGFLYLR